MRVRLGALRVGLALLGATTLAFAHHSFAAEFDGKKPVTLTGMVMRVEWMNPHAHFLISVQDEAGITTTWDLALASPNGLMSEGWRRDSVKAGDQITIEGSRAKDGSNFANAHRVTFADGRKLFAGP